MRNPSYEKSRNKTHCHDCRSSSCLIFNNQLLAVRLRGARQNFIDINRSESVSRFFQFFGLHAVVKDISFCHITSAKYPRYFLKNRYTQLDRRNGGTYCRARTVRFYFKTRNQLECGYISRYHGSQSHPLRHATASPQACRFFLREEPLPLSAVPIFARSPAMLPIQAFPFENKDNAHEASLLLRSLTRQRPASVSYKCKPPRHEQSSRWMLAAAEYHRKGRPSRATATADGSAFFHVHTHAAMAAGKVF